MKKKTLGVVAGLMAVLLAVAGSVKLYDYFNPKEDELCNVCPIFPEDYILDPQPELIILEIIQGEDTLFTFNAYDQHGDPIIKRIFSKDSFLNSIQISFGYFHGSYASFNRLFRLSYSSNNTEEGSFLSEGGAPSIHFKTNRFGHYSFDMSGVNVDSFDYQGIVVDYREIMFSDLAPN